MELKHSEVNTIVYQKDGGQPEERKIVPTFVPHKVVKAVDVGDLTTEQAGEIVDLIREYSEYQAEHMKQMFNFETWAEHTKNKTVTPKWRSFKVENIVEVK